MAWIRVVEENEAGDALLKVYQQVKGAAVRSPTSWPHTASTRRHCKLTWICTWPSCPTLPDSLGRSAK